MVAGDGGRLERLEMKQLTCRDMGNECDEVIVGATTDEVLEKTVEHVVLRHPETELSDVAKAEVRLLISDA